MNTMTRMLNVTGKLYVGLLLLFLYLPIIIMALMSFNASPFYMLPIEWSTVWYQTFFANSQLIAATWNSVFIAVIMAVGSASVIRCTRARCRSLTAPTKQPNDSIAC